MKTPRTFVGMAFVCGAAAFAARGQLLDGTSSTLPSLDLAILSAFPPPPDDPLLDSSGNVVMDPGGHPVSDPKEQFHQAKPFEYDPDHLDLVQAAWLNGIGCPPGDSACPTGDRNDEHNEGLLLVKTGSTANNTSAGAELKKVRGITLTELGYDIRKSGTNGLSPLGSHCGNGSPRFNVYTTDGTLHFVGCNSPPGEMEGTSTGWVRLRWRAAELAAAFPPILPTEIVSRIQIIFDDGQDAGPDFFGAAILDNIDVNGQLVGAGPPDAK